MLKLTGLDKLTSELKQAQRAFAEIEGRMGSVNFDPYDPVSIEVAIQSMEQMIDEKMGNYRNNSIVGPMIEGMKDKYREAIVERAGEARMEDGSD